MPQICKRCNYSQESQLPTCLRCGAPKNATDKAGPPDPLHSRSANNEAKQRAQGQAPKANPSTQHAPKKAPKTIAGSSQAKRDTPSQFWKELKKIGLALAVIAFLGLIVYGNLDTNDSLPQREATDTTRLNHQAWPIETIPAWESTSRLTATEHNFCAAEEIRVEAMAAFTETLLQVAIFSIYSNLLDQLCDSGRTSVSLLQEARKNASREANRLTEEARKRLAGESITDRDHQIIELVNTLTQTAFVVVDVANVRSEPSINAQRISRLEAMHEVMQFGPAEDGWINIMFFDQDEVKGGYIADRLVRTGSIQTAWEIYCEIDRTQRPASGHVFDRTGTGVNSLMVSVGDLDTIVKLRDQQGDVLSFFIRANETAWIADVPDGVFNVLFASGAKFSSKCMNFLGTMNVIATHEPILFESRNLSPGISYTEQHIDLRQERHGNLRLRSLTPNDFWQ